MTPAARKRLAARVRARRRELGLAGVEAARRAGVARATWEALERASRDLRDANYAGVERALQWAPGAVETVLDGGEPTPLDQSDQPLPEQVRDRWRDPETGEVYTDPVERQLWAMDAVSASVRRRFIYVYRADRGTGRTDDRRAG